MAAPLRRPGSFIRPASVCRAIIVRIQEDGLLRGVSGTGGNSQIQCESVAGARHARAAPTNGALAVGKRSGAQRGLSSRSRIALSDSKFQSCERARGSPVHGVLAFGR
jgi:hypothetical protein